MEFGQASLLCRLHLPAMDMTMMTIMKGVVPVQVIEQDTDGTNEEPN